MTSSSSTRPGGCWSGACPEGMGGLSVLHALIGDHLGEDQEPDSVIIGIETDRGPWVAALAAAGYTVFAVNPLQVARYRERHGVSGAKSDRGDAHILAEFVRLDRAHHKPLAPDSTVAEQVKVLARSHQTMIWARQRQGNLLRSTLREFYPAALLAFGEDLTGRDSMAVLAAAPSPARGLPCRSPGSRGCCAGRPAAQPRVDRDPGPGALRSPQLVGTAAGRHLRGHRRGGRGRDHRAEPPDRHARRGGGVPFWPPPGR